MKVRKEKDHGVIISNTIKVNGHCSAASEKANMMLRLISRDIVFKSFEVMKRLYMAFLILHLEWTI